MVVAVAALRYVVQPLVKPPAELVERRLTFNSSASPIASAVISPDGNYLAYSDPTGIHVRLLRTGEERMIPMPTEVLTGAPFYVASWFPNGTELLVWREDRSMWAISVFGRSSRELRSNVSTGQVSPDGTRIIFNPIKPGSDPPEIWVMDNQGANPHKILGLSAGELL